jgi:hypothetical protein
LSAKAEKSSFSDFDYLEIYDRIYTRNWKAGNVIDELCVFGMKGDSRRPSQGAGARKRREMAYKALKYNESEPLLCPF